MKWTIADSARLARWIEFSVRAKDFYGGNRPAARRGHARPAAHHARGFKNYTVVERKP
jgi:hypothetical protein